MIVYRYISYSYIGQPNLATDPNCHHVLTCDWRSPIIEGHLPPEPAALLVHVEDLERRLTEALGLRVRIALGRKKGTGAIQVRFETLEEFDHLTERLGLPPQ